TRGGADVGWPSHGAAAAPQASRVIAGHCPARVPFPEGVRHKPIQRRRARSTPLRAQRPSFAKVGWLDQIGAPPLEESPSSEPLTGPGYLRYPCDPRSVADGLHAGRMRPSATASISLLERQADLGSHRFGRQVLRVNLVLAQLVRHTHLV